jgi:hypothetical protein
MTQYRQAKTISPVAADHFPFPPNLLKYTEQVAEAALFTDIPNILS